MNPEIWQGVAAAVMNELKDGETLALSLMAEDSLYVRMTQAKVRQSTEVQQGAVELSYFMNRRNVKITVPFAFQLEKDLRACREALKDCRQETEGHPEDLLLQLPLNHGALHQIAEQKAPRYPLIEKCLNGVQSTDFVGILTTGKVVRANANSQGLKQWFESSTFSVDFSFYTPTQQAVKGLYGGQQWKDEDYAALIAKKRDHLDHLSRSPITLEKKKYRTYFSAQAVATLIASISWTGFVSREAYESGQCAFKKLVDGEKSLSPYLSLRENYSLGQTPRFNEFGEISDVILPLVDQGDFKTLLCSSRSAKKYNLPSNFASASETLRSPEILPGHLVAEKELEVLGTGLYVADVHYLNWSDVQEGRITGMTRFGCFWVENGQIVAPVKDMRFDESLYHFWGVGLEGFSDKSETYPKTNTYFQRDVGTIQAPGMLVNDFTFVL